MINWLRRGWATSEHLLSAGVITAVAGAWPMSDTAKIVVGSVAAIYTAARTALKAIAAAKAAAK